MFSDNVTDSIGRKNSALVEIIIIIILDHNSLSVQTHHYRTVKLYNNAFTLFSTFLQYIYSVFTTWQVPKILLCRRFVFITRFCLKKIIHKICLRTRQLPSNNWGFNLYLIWWQNVRQNWRLHSIYRNCIYIHVLLQINVTRKETFYCTACSFVCPSIISLSVAFKMLILY